MLAHPQRRFPLGAHRHHVPSRQAAPFADPHLIHIADQLPRQGHTQIAHQPVRSATQRQVRVTHRHVVGQRLGRRHQPVRDHRHALAAVFRVLHQLGIQGRVGIGRVGDRCRLEQVVQIRRAGIRAAQDLVGVRVTVGQPLDRQRAVFIVRPGPVRVGEQSRQDMVTHPAHICRDQRSRRVARFLHGHFLPRNPGRAPRSPTRLDREAHVVLRLGLDRSGSAALVQWLQPRSGRSLVGELELSQRLGKQRHQRRHLPVMLSHRLGDRLVDQPHPNFRDAHPRQVLQTFKAK